MLVDRSENRDIPPFRIEHIFKDAQTVALRYIQARMYRAAHCHKLHPKSQHCKTQASCSCTRTAPQSHGQGYIGHRMESEWLGGKWQVEQVVTIVEIHRPSISEPMTTLILLPGWPACLRPQCIGKRTWQVSPMQLGPQWLKHHDTYNRNASHTN